MTLFALEGVVPGNQLLLFAVFGERRPPPFLMPREGLLFWVLVSILLSVVLSVVLTVLLNLLLLF